MFGEKRQKFEIQLQKRDVKKQHIFLYAQMTKLSHKSREIVFYCPYLIMNETDKNLVYREYGLTQDILSIDEV